MESRSRFAHKFIRSFQINRGATGMMDLRKAFVFSIVMVKSAEAKPLLRNGDSDRKPVEQFDHRSLQTSLQCKIRALDGQFEDGTDKEFYQCYLDRNNDGLYEYSYMIDLPDYFVKSNRECILSGDCILNIPGGEAHDDGSPTISVPVAAAMSAEDKSTPDSGGERRKLAVTGDHPTLVVRVSSADRSCEPSAIDLAGSVFGLGPRALDNNMAQQYWDCSNGQLSFSPFNVGSNIVNGVVDVYIPQNIWGKDVFSLQNQVHQATVDKIGNSLIASKHIMYVFPWGTTFDGSSNWVAFANMHGKSSYYNNKWGDRLSAQVHEIGHNLGMQHSNENGGEYGDTSGMMGFSHPTRNGPRMCFNALKNYEFGWYADQTVFIDTSSNNVWTGEIASFVDAKFTSKHVILRLGGAYLQLNSAKKFNEGTKEKRNKVVVVEGSRFVPSNVVAGLSSGDAIKVGGKTVHVCSISFGSVDYAQISIYGSGQSSGCPGGDPSDEWYCFIPFLC